MTCPAPLLCACSLSIENKGNFVVISCRIDVSEQTCRSHAEPQAGGGMGSIAAGADPPHAEGAKLDQAQILKSKCIAT